MTIQDIRDLPSFKWATVRSVDPISIQLDGDSAPLALIPDSLVDPLLLKVGDRVRVELSLRKCVIHGKSNGVFIEPERNNWVTPALMNSFQHASSWGARYAVSSTRVELQGGLWRATAPSSFTTAFQLPSEVPRPRDQVRYYGRDDGRQQVAITSDGQVQIYSSAAHTSGIGYVLDGVGYAY